MTVFVDAFGGLWALGRKAAINRDGFHAVSVGDVFTSPAFAPIVENVRAAWTLAADGDRVPVLIPECFGVTTH